MKTFPKVSPTNILDVCIIVVITVECLDDLIFHQNRVALERRFFLLPAFQGPPSILGHPHEEDERTQRDDDDL